MKKLVHNTACSVFCVLAVACVASSTPDTTTQDQPPFVRVGHVGHDHHLALYVAVLESARFERDYGIWLKEIKPREIYELLVSNKPIARLQLIKVEGGAHMPAAMARGELDMGLGGLSAIAKFADNGEPIKVICPLQTGGDMLVMRKGSGITNWTGFVAAAKKPEGRPLRIGYKAAIAVAKNILEGALKAEGISYGYDATKGDVRVILVNFAAEASPVPLLESGAIDGFVMNQPGAAIAVHKGVGQIVADLEDLPPPGKWRHHPCCCIAATEQTITTRPEVIKEFLKLILLGTQLIRLDQPLAIECASRWTKNDVAVERASVPIVHYVAEPTRYWVNGFRTWAETLHDLKLFTGRYAQLTPDEILKHLCDFSACTAAATELRQAGLLRPAEP